jgi:hypothetical protein
MHTHTHTHTHTIGGQADLPLWRSRSKLPRGGASAPRRAGYGGLRGGAVHRHSPRLQDRVGQQAGVCVCVCVCVCLSMSVSVSLSLSLYIYIYIM